MGSTLASNCFKQVRIPKQLQIITESGKTFVLTPKPTLKVHSVKKFIEMRIGTKRQYLRLFIKTCQSTPNTSDNSSSDDEKYLPQTQAISSSPVKTKQTSIPPSCQNSDSKFQDLSQEIGDDIELNDNFPLTNYSKYLIMNPRIYVFHDSNPHSHCVEIATRNEQRGFQIQSSDSLPGFSNINCPRNQYSSTELDSDNRIGKPGMMMSISEFEVDNTFDENNESKLPFQQPRFHLKANRCQLDMSSHLNSMNCQMSVIQTRFNNLEDSSFQIESTPHF